MRNAKKDEIEMAEKRRRLLESGFRLFSERSIEAVTMQDIAKDSGIGIATLYRYFNTKLALVITIGAKKWTEIFEEIRQRYRALDGQRMTAAEEFAFYLDCYIYLYTHRRALLCFNQNFNNFVLHEKATPEQMKPYNDSIRLFAERFHVLYSKALQDGTLRTDLPERKMFAVTMHLMLAAVVRFAQGLVYLPDEEQNMTEELLLLRDMMFDAYRTKEDRA